MDLELSLKERLFLANQYNILAKLADDEYEADGFKELSEIMSEGYSRYYSKAVEHFSEELTQEQCEFVVHVLELYRALRWSWENNADVKANVEEREVLFQGFDANDSVECRFMSYYEFMVGTQDKWAEIKELMREGKIESFNSHGFGPSMETLEKRSQRRIQICNENNSWGELLTLAQVQDILAIF